jgi:hypothetical protein
LLHQVGDLFELNVKLRCQKVKHWTFVVEFDLHSEKGGVRGWGSTLEEAPELQRATEDISLNYSQVLSFNFLSL